MAHSLTYCLSAWFPCAPQRTEEICCIAQDQLRRQKQQFHWREHSIRIMGWCGKCACTQGFFPIQQKLLRYYSAKLVVSQRVLEPTRNDKKWQPVSMFRRVMSFPSAWADNLTSHSGMAWATCSKYLLPLSFRLCYTSLTEYEPSGQGEIPYRRWRLPVQSSPRLDVTIIVAPIDLVKFQGRRYSPDERRNKLG